MSRLKKAINRLDRKGLSVEQVRIVPCFEDFVNDLAGQICSALDIPREALVEDFPHTSTHRAAAVWDIPR